MPEERIGCLPAKRWTLGIRNQEGLPNHSTGHVGQLVRVGPDPSKEPRGGCTVFSYPHKKNGFRYDLYHYLKRRETFEF